MVCFVTCLYGYVLGANISPDTCNPIVKCGRKEGFKGHELKHLALVVISLLFAPQFSLAAESNCTMQPAPINIHRIAHRPEVKSYSVDKNKLALTALLKNGQVVRLVHEGCAHSGAEAALWFESNIAASDVNNWLKEVNKLSRIAFAPDIVKDIERSLNSGNFKKEVTETRLVISAAPTEYFSYTVVLAPAEHGMILSITYILG